MATKAQSYSDKLSRSKRSQTVLTFPSDLDTEESGASILFNINVPTGSKYIGTKYNAVENSSSIESSSSNSLSRKFSARTQRIDTSIRLWVPGSITNSSSADWNRTDLNSVGAMMDAAASIGSIDLDSLSNAWQVGKSVLPDTIVNAGASVIQTITPFNVQDAKNWYTNKISNPYMELVFNGLSNRSFSFSFKMIPRSVDEANVIRQICKEFKFHQAPEYKLSDANIYWSAPSSFDIKMMYGSEESDKLFKISTCALVSCSVKQGSDGGFAYFHDGTPIVTTLDLTFQEMELITKERVEEGY